jgi:hypothetical protein
MYDLSSKIRLLKQGDLIISTVDWLERQIQKELEAGDRALSKHNYAELEKSDKNVIILIQKLRREDKNIKFFLEQYKKVIENEEKKMLSDNGKKK